MDFLIGCVEVSVVLLYVPFYVSASNAIGLVRLFQFLFPTGQNSLDLFFTYSSHYIS